LIDTGTGLQRESSFSFLQVDFWLVFSATFVEEAVFSSSYVFGAVAKY
jgi:hypothetical protein